MLDITTLDAHSMIRWRAHEGQERTLHEQGPGGPSAAMPALVEKHGAGPRITSSGARADEVHGYSEGLLVVRIAPTERAFRDARTRRESIAVVDVRPAKPGQNTEPETRQYCVGWYCGP